MKPIIRVENLSKQYRIGLEHKPPGHLRAAVREMLKSSLKRVRGSSAGEEDDLIWALKDVSFEVRPGEVVGIIGRNGAGKSTLLKILSRITEPTIGRVQLYGRIGSLLEVGTGFHPELTGRENIFLNGAMLGMPRSEIQRKFDEIVAFAGIGKFLDTPVKRYSSGMYTRLAFAVAAHLDPAILLIDEVLSVGDAEFQAKCLGKMKDVAQEGRTVLYVSHNLPSIAMLCGRALYFSSGRLIEDASAEKVIERYMGGATTGSPSIEWETAADAPGSSRLRLRSVRVLNQLGSVSRAFAMDEPVFIEVTYWVLSPNVKSHVGYHLHNATGVLVFISIDFHDIEWMDTPKRLGCYRSICEIPGKFLNRGTYVLDVVVSTSAIEPDVLEREVVAFELVDDGTSEVRGRYTGEWFSGALRPKLQWKTTPVSENEQWD